MLFHADVSWLVTSIFAGKACLGAFICAWPSRKLKISRAFCVVSRGRILPCHLNFCWESLLGGFHMRMAKQETENFASVWCCFTRTYLGLTPQFLLGKLAWGLGYAHGIEPKHPLYDNSWPVAMQIGCHSSVASPFSIQGERKQDIIRIVIYCVGRIMGTAHEPTWDSDGQMRHFGSRRFTKVWAEVPPKCLKGCPLSHLGSPRFGPRYHLSVSKVAL